MNVDFQGGYLLLSVYFQGFRKPILKNKTAAALDFYSSMTCLYIIVNLVIVTKGTNIFIPIFL